MSDRGAPRKPAKPARSEPQASEVKGAKPAKPARSEPQASEVKRAEPAKPARSEPQASEVQAGPPPLRPFGLVLHHDGRFTHEGLPITNARLRAAFDRGVRFLPDEGKYVVQLGRFRGEVEVEEAGFFVRSVDLARGTVALSDGSEEPLEVASLRPSPIDAAFLCTVKRELVPDGLPARFTHAAQAELLEAVVEGEGGVASVAVGGRLERIPPL